ncbi:zinc finger CCCH-type with G patch domain-containing protein isoform X1 [Athalia rosae]|uniref:zinc finger CCCH-type with G patch domain-containing protein isoform X1 n=1 Tax=Athalia rosae TaxID=37344 RepID=UPI0020338ABD|nr:zinc finger CCCH-type with G patch domain-containing protein isoform X1 [Athalia rosae]XP_020706213.2 zinc finger CCCH-type with G patch domain-containing protein isoform X1 [Athalia rosae]
MVIISDGENCQNLFAKAKHKVLSLTIGFSNMTDIDSLTVAIEQYENQLAQVQIALSIATSGPDKENLLSLRSDIQELINLTRENLNSLKETSTTDNKSQDTDEADDPLAEEYALFKTVLGETLDKSDYAQQNESTTGISADIDEDLKALKGMKCRAPHGSGWGGISHHNAMVCSTHAIDEAQITSMNDIKVRVMFTNPTHKEMLPCPYFLDGNCKFSDDQCHYSHGEIVSLSSLQEYSEPDFATIKMGSRVLAKQKNQIWHRAVVLKVPEIKQDDYRVKFESSGTILELSLHDLLPLSDADLNMSNSSDDSDSENDAEEFNKDELVQQSLLMTNGNEALGSWERYTRGIGSKLMASMGYVTGTGLGKRADGRVEPVQATVLPPGKSLDHCMELRENANGDKDLFSVERRLKRQQQRMDQLREKQYQKEIRNERSNVFNFINSTLGDKAAQDDLKACSSVDKSNLKTETSQKLNVASLQIGENIRKIEKDASKLQDSLRRHVKGTLPYNNIVLQYNQKQKELGDLRIAEKKIVAEQDHRRSKAKLTIF